MIESIARVLCLGALWAGLAVPLEGQGAVSPMSPVYNGDWRASWDAQGRLRFLWGGSQPLGGRTPHDPESSARAVVDELADTLGFGQEALILDGIRHLRLSRIGSTDKHAVAFRVSKDGVPVHRASVNLLFSADGALLALENNTVGSLARAATQAERRPDHALEVASRAFVADTGTTAVRIELAAPDVVLHPGDDDLLELVYLVHATAALEPPSPPRRQAFAVAARGPARIVDSWSLVHEAGAGQQSSRSPAPGSGGVPDVRGAVTGWSQAGLEPWGGAPPALLPLGDVRLDGPGGVVLHTEPDGSFATDGTSAGRFRARLSGAYSEVLNWSGAESELAQALVSGVPAAYVFNPNQTELTAAEVGAHLGVQRFREWVVGVDPTETLFDFPVLTVVNFDTGCNGFFDGTQILLSASDGTCANAAYSTFVWHEEGHWANVLFGSGNPSDGFGEGAADAWANYIADDPLVGRHFYGPDQHLRSGWNTRSFCLTGAGCYGEPHDDGEVLMGALWKVRTRLEATLGDVAGGAAADLLFLSWFQAFDADGITDRIRDQWLCLDDDDGNISNGTPNKAAIDCGFQAQGFPIDGAVLSSLFGQGLTGTDGVAPVLWSCGRPELGEVVQHHVHGGLPFAAGELFVGTSQASVPFRGGTLFVGDIDQAIPLVLDGSGSLTYSLTLPTEPAAIGSELFLQWWGLDSAGPSGYSSTNGLTYTIEGP